LPSELVIAVQTRGFEWTVTVTVEPAGAVPINVGSGGTVGSPAAGLPPIDDIVKLTAAAVCKGVGLGVGFHATDHPSRYGVTLLFIVLRIALSEMIGYVLGVRPERSMGEELKPDPLPGITVSGTGVPDPSRIWILTLCPLGSAVQLALVQPPRVAGLMGDDVKLPTASVR
jgi:hypothetical protein